MMMAKWFGSFMVLLCKLWLRKKMNDFGGLWFHSEVLIWIFFRTWGSGFQKKFGHHQILLWFCFIWKFPELKNLQFQSFQKAPNNWWLSWNNNQFHRRLFDGLDGFHEIINKELTHYERLFYRFLDFKITTLSFPDVTSNKWGAPFSNGNFTHYNYSCYLFIVVNQIVCVHYK